MKLKGVGPVFKVCGGVLVIKRRGCECFKVAKLVICDLAKGFEWYMIRSEGLSGI